MPNDIDIPTPAKPFYFSNSSVGWMKCQRRYVLQMVYGLRVPAETSWNIGSVFHHYMRLLKPGDNLMYVLMLPVYKPKDTILGGVPEHLVTRLAHLAISITDQLGTPINGPIVKEQFLDDAGPDDLGATWVGTPDRLELMRLAGGVEYLVITDYKTTHKSVRDPALQMGYRLQSQFSMYALLLLRVLLNTPERFPALAPFQDAVSQGNIASRHIFITHAEKAFAEGSKEPQFAIMNPTPLEVNELAVMRTMFQEKEELASFLHVHPHLAHKDGMLTGSCWGCPFQQICSLKNAQLEETAIERWPLGRAPYEPTHGNTEPVIDA